MNKILTSFLFLASFAAVTPAQENYVVRVDSQTVYLDITKSTDCAKTGAGFIIYEPGDELKNPVTGELLGKISKDIAGGTVTQTAEKYAIGTLQWSNTEAKPGQLFRWQAVAPQTPGEKNAFLQGKTLWKSQPLKMKAVGLAQGKFDGTSTQLAVASESEVLVYKVKDGALEELFSFSPGGLYRIISIDAADLKKTGRDQLFAVVLDRQSNRLQTMVLETSSAGTGPSGREAGPLGQKLNQTVLLNYLVRAVVTPHGKTLYTQSVSDSGQNQLSDIKPLVFANGKFSQAKERFAFSNVEWLYGFSVVKEENGVPALTAYLNNVNRLCAQFPVRSENMETDNVFGKTPNILRYGSATLKFYPRIPVGANGTMLYAVENKPAPGLMSETFGKYKDGTLYALSWNGNALATVAQTPLEGYLADIDAGSVAAQEGLLAAVVHSNGTSTVRLLAY